LQAFDDRRANLRPSVAAIPEQEHRNVAKLGKVGAVDDRSASPFGRHKTRTGEDREMRRQRVRRDLQQAGKITGGKAPRLVPDQRPESLQTGRLREGGEGQNCFFNFHISRIIEI